MRYMQYDRGLAWSTIVNYSIDLKQFIRHLRWRGVTRALEITVDEVHAFLATLEKHSFAPNSINEGVLRNEVRTGERPGANDRDSEGRQTLAQLA